MKVLTMASLFAGIGGFELSATWAGIEPIWSNEIDPWCCKVLRKNFNQPFNNLPESLEILGLLGNFNQTIDNLPNTINLLMFGKKFDKPIKMFPSSLKELKISQKYKYPLPNNIKIKG